MREYDPNHRYQVITCASADFTDEDNLFVLYCPVDPVLRPACINVPLRFKVSDPAF